MAESNDNALVGTAAILNADKDDEALNKYKASLGIAETVIIDENNPNCLIPKTLSIAWCDPANAEHNIVIDMENPDSSTQYNVKQGEEFNLSVGFQVQRDMVTCLTMNVSMKKFMMGFGEKYVLGSYAANTADVKTWTCREKDEFPKSNMAKGNMNMKVSFESKEVVDGKEKKVVPCKPLTIKLNVLPEWK